MGDMSNVYFSISALFIASLLMIIFFSKKRVKNIETKIYQFMIISGLLCVVFNVIAIFLIYAVHYDDLSIWFNKFEQIQYVFWASLLFLYIAELSLSGRKFYNRIRQTATKVAAVVVLAVVLISMCLPLYLHNENGVLYNYGSSLDLIYLACAVFFLLIIIMIISNIKNVLNKKYIPIFALLLFGAILFWVTSVDPGLIIAPAILTYVNLIMFFTIENPDAKIIEEKEKINEQLEQLSKTKDEFMSLASHQLRTPLTSIRGYSSMLLDEDMGKLNNVQKHAMKEIESSSERMVFLVRDFLNVSRIQAGNFVLDRIKTNLVEVLNEDIEQLQTIANDHKVKLIKKLPANLTEIPELNIDRERIGEIMANLIDNAIFYSHGGKSVEISLARVNDVVEFRVVDHGIGVPVKDQENLFTKFFRASNAQTVRPDGTGIGLFLVQKVIKEHGGKIIFHSVQGKGSTFGFSLPIKTNSVVDADKDKEEDEDKDK